MTTALINILVATFFGWVLHEITSFYLLRKKVKAYLLIVIPCIIKDFRVSNDQMEDFFTHKLAIGNGIKAAPIHRSESLELISCVKIEAIKYLSKDEVKRFSHFYIALYELDGLMKGFSSHLVDHERKNKQLDEDTYRHLQIHIERSRKILDQLPDESDFSCLNELPKNYRFINKL